MKTKIYIVTGFLGSGKTTLVKRILTSSQDLSKTIVLVNEFGKVGIDSDLIKHTATANIVELTSGCICCSLKTDMIQTLQILRYDYSPEQIVIEATGVADPLSIIEALGDRMLSSHFCLEKTITVVDIDFWEAREAFGSVFKSQLRQADIILLNKIDTIDSPDIPSVLKEIKAESGGGIIIPTLHCNVDPDIFWSHPDQKKASETKNFNFHPYDPANDVYSPKNSEAAQTAKDAGFITFSFENTQVLDEKKFLEFLKVQPLELFRIKGPVKFSDKTRMLNYVGGKSDWQKWPDKITTCLAFIGWGVIEEQIIEQLTRCLVKA